MALLKPIDSVLVHKVVPSRRSGTSYPTLIMLHGRGANEDDLLSLAEYLDERLLIISPRAPFPFTWGGGYTWYEILNTGSPEPKMFAESYTRLVQFLDDVQRGYPVDAERIYLLGFSMGTMMSYAMLLTEPERIAGVVAHSGYVPEEHGLNLQGDVRFRWDMLRGKSIFIAHGLYDPVIPVQLARKTRALFSKTEADVTYKEYPMAHQISEESLEEFSHWLTQRINGRD